MIIIATVYVEKIKKSDYQTNTEYEIAQAAAVERAIRRFKKKVQNENILNTWRDHQEYTKPSDKERWRKNAIKRHNEIEKKKAERTKLY